MHHTYIHSCKDNQWGRTSAGCARLCALSCFLDVHLAVFSRLMRTAWLLQFYSSSVSKVRIQAQFDRNIFSTQCWFDRNFSSNFRTCRILASQATGRANVPIFFFYLADPPYQCIIFMRSTLLASIFYSYIENTWRLFLLCRYRHTRRLIDSHAWV